MKKGKRLLSTLLVCCLVVLCIPLSASAIETSAVSNQIQLSEDACFSIAQNYWEDYYQYDSDSDEAVSEISLKTPFEISLEDLRDYYWYYNIQSWLVWSFEEDGTVSQYYTEQPLALNKASKTNLRESDLVPAISDGEITYSFDGDTLTLYEGGYDTVLNLYDKAINPATVTDTFVENEIAQYDGTLYFYETNWDDTDPGANATYLVRLGKKPSTSVVPSDSASGRFSDVPASAYYADAVDWAVDNGITSGTSDTTFSPNDTCTRAQMVTFLWRAAGSTSVNDILPFTDVDQNAYYAEAVRWAVSEGITSGTSNTTFSPNAPITRSHTVILLHRYAGAPDLPVSSSFVDVADTAYYALAVQWAVNEGITTGTSSTTFSPDTSCTRAQIVTFLYRALAN